MIDALDKLHTIEVYSNWLANVVVMVFATIYYMDNWLGKSALLHSNLYRLQVVRGQSLNIIHYGLTNILWQVINDISEILHPSIVF